MEAVLPDGLFQQDAAKQRWFWNIAVHGAGVCRPSGLSLIQHLWDVLDKPPLQITGLKCSAANDHSSPLSSVESRPAVSTGLIRNLLMRLPPL